MASSVYPEPPDGGWGWMVVLAAFFQTALVFGVIRSFGVFFVEFVQYFDKLSGSVSWITSIGIAVQQFGSPLASALCTRYGARPVIMTGGLVSGLGMFLASFASSLMHLYLCIGLLSGLGWAMVFTPSIASVARYFKKRRSLATGLAFTGVGLSSFAFSPLFQYLVDVYAWRGALIILSGMTFNLLVCGALIRPLTLKEDLLALEAVERDKDRNCLGQCFSLFGLSLLSHWPFMRYVLAITLINTGYFVPYVHLVAHARGEGFSEYQAAFVMSVAAAADLCGRIFSGWMADLGRFKILHILVFWTSFTGLSLLLIPLGQNYSTLLAISTGYGFCAGAMTPVVFSLLPEIVGIGHIFGALGLLQLLESIGGLLGAPLSGWLRDLTGDYSTSFYVAGGFLLLGSLVLCTLPNVFSCSTAKPLDQLAVAPEV
ncbi:monocarboxylate transporter 13-like [Microcaecilia unicolor]|uniref:Monocarboxylate transporter 13 n=1 Tax=Microcaecilia unicolor TaxID=1415580 RepID=A0A6P7WJ42_9AMPH|nr:monocarboxylate transporter 13-like [Microcaecilia unicolor]XP_030043315.1 monocarboxylate transporter 13-like [Microcaecilia unicolor]XP_030043316.1 monocarboxylate transporter 13-like [Microcaecilia unicolor]XP_030043317.1 monocarboxylate transporter 13-like [Microcaecilia unicolor]XP_030043318.1 monocarboxylate transporter 13-like [Microcaecilia unicolor]XP_030043319.1 monocarboxylate transporter 13-like [Microcaecilia unicolor]XP_030043320.1 monocarboxylate transporter 13-like [Microca